MSNEELVQLIRQGIDSAGNMEQLYIQNKGLIYKIALHYRIDSRTDIEDLVQEGYLGLYEAVQRYEDDREVKFTTYSAFWIRQAIQRYFENNRGSVRASSAMQANYNRYRKIVSNFYKHFGRNPSDDELMFMLGCSLAALDKTRSYGATAASVASLDVTIGEDKEATLADTIQGLSGIENDILDKILDRERKSGLWLIVSENTTAIESDVIFNRYHENKTLKETGEVIGVTADRVRVIEKKALRKLRRVRVKNILRQMFYTEEIEASAYRISTEKAALARLYLDEISAIQ